MKKKLCQHHGRSYCVPGVGIPRLRRAGVSTELKPHRATCMKRFSLQPIHVNMGSIRIPHP